MPGFDDRQKNFENKFKLDEEAQFKLQARAVRLFGLWAAKQLGMSGADADAYAEEVVDSDFDEPGIQDVIRKVMADFSGKGMDVTAAHLEKQYSLHLDEARKSMLSSGA